ncbi:protein GFS12 isoform X1 [Daucus carota subsp. sativus]|nr:PREDICTED: protein GFS12 isoform X1 [Daucus carota subsp. sativus]
MRSEVGAEDRRSRHREMKNEMCFSCLQNRIHSDFSDKVMFNYALSTSPLPFATTAVVQLADSGEDVSPQFTLVYIPKSDSACLVKYINVQIGETLDGDRKDKKNHRNLSIMNQDKAAFGIERSELEVKSHESQCFLNGGGKTSFGWLGCDTSTCNFSGRFSCLRTITALAPVSQIGITSYPMFKQLALKFLSGELEDDILCSLSVLIEGKATGRDSVNFLNLVGVPSFDENISPGCVRHPNIVPILGMLTSADHVNLVLPKAPYTLENILHYNPGALKSDWHIRFLIYQLLSAVSHLHSLGITHGSLCPSNVLLNDMCWLWLHVSYAQRFHFNIESKSEESSTFPPLEIGCCTERCHSQELYADLKLSPSIDWQSSFSSWWTGELSNFEYLLVLNKLAGRRWGDHTFHTVMPWVIDFSAKPDENCDVGWRDLRKSKWRLAKGDEQLDFTYLTSEIPHHVSDECLSELAVCSYKARRLPLSVLRMAVRSVYEPNEYPSTMQRLFQWTPDECIPEFYYDPLIFKSLHSGMSDLAVPSWSGTAEEFINLHRGALESERVSGEIHHWIDTTFGYKMSGEPAVAAKNVMLPASTSTTLRSVGRRQLFTQPHPARQCGARRYHKSLNESCLHGLKASEGLGEKLIIKTSCLQDLEEMDSFSEHARHLSPIYTFQPRHHVNNDLSVEELQAESSGMHILKEADAFNMYRTPTIIDSNYLLESVEVDNDCFLGYQELLLWKQNSSSSEFMPKVGKLDIFSIGCILAEIYLGKPLFDPKSLEAYLKTGILPKLMKGLPPHAEVVVEACIQKEQWRRPSAKSLLESPYFPATVSSVYIFLAPLQHLSTIGSRIRYAATFAKQGALKAMGAFAAEMCAPHCLVLIAASLTDSEGEWAFILLKEFLRCLDPLAAGTLIVPAIQKILQAAGYSHLKVSILQDSFVQELWKSIGKQKYLEKLHPMVLSNLYGVLNKSTAAAASVLLVGSSEELGVPITIHQTILPLIQYYGKGLCSDGIDVVIRIGVLFGENFVVNQVLPVLRSIASSCIDASRVNKPEPLQSWGTLALLDCLMTLDGLVVILKEEVVVKELIEEGNCIYVQVLMQSTTGIPVLQAAARSLIAVCHQIGPNLTALQVLPKLKDLFSELAFSQEASASSASSGGRVKDCKKKTDEVPIDSRMDLVLLLYPPLASLLGIEKLRQCCATWLLLEQFLLRCYNWKWEYTGESSGPENINSRIYNSKSSRSEFSPARKLLNTSGWSIPQSQGYKGPNTLKPHTWSHEYHHNPVDHPVRSSNVEKHEPWYWFPSPASTWNGPYVLGRGGGSKDELPWKIKASVIHSVRAHHGAVRCFAVQQDECKLFTAGVGQGFKGTIQKWDLSRINCLSGYQGHEEVVNEICLLASSERVASCDGTVHIWNSQTGKLISVFTEFSEDSVHHISPLTSGSRANLDQANMLNFNPHLSGIMTTAFDGSLYTSLHFLQNINRLVMGTGNGSLRFLDVVQGQKLHLWRTESPEASFPSLISSICSCGSDKMQGDGIAASPSWVAAGLSSGKCRLLDVRSGHIIASWQAHDGYITKLAAPEDHMLVSSSLDRTLRIWDLRRNWTSESTVFKGHSDSVSGFSVWGQDVISISRNKIGLSSLSRPAYEEGQHYVTPQYLYMADRELRNLSAFSSITILPYSRLFLLGTEDGYLKICC